MLGGVDGEREINKPILVCQNQQLLTIHDLEFAKDTAAMVTHGNIADRKPSRDVFIF